MNFTLNANVNVSIKQLCTILELTKMYQKDLYEPKKHWWYDEEFIRDFKENLEHFRKRKPMLINTFSGSYLISVSMLLNGLHDYVEETHDYSIVEQIDGELHLKVSAMYPEIADKILQYSLFGDIVEGDCSVL